MNDLAQYILSNCIKGSCTCEECINSENKKSDEHTADLQLLKVALKDPNEDKEIIKNELMKLIKEHKKEFLDINIFDGKEHNFIEIGSWIGNQGLALMFMGM